MLFILFFSLMLSGSFSFAMQNTNEFEQPYR